MASNYPLLGRTALVTGVSRRRGIGCAIGRRLARDGASVFVSHWGAHDAEQPWGRDDIRAVSAEVRRDLAPQARFGELSLDLADPDAPSTLVDAALGLTGTLEILVCNQARSGQDGSMLDMTAQFLDAHYAVNARATVLLTAAFARAFTGQPAPQARPGDAAAGLGLVGEHATGRVVWLTSGQARPMPGEVAYAMSKAALAGLVPTAASELLHHGILLNAIDPGPVNTGYLDEATSDRDAAVVEQVLAAMPLGRFGLPDDVARLVSWLVGDEGRWVAGQVLTSDSGFSLT